MPIDAHSSQGRPRLDSCRKGPETEEADPVAILALRGLGASLTLSAAPLPRAGQEEPWFDVSIEAAGPPFRGTVTTIMTAADLRLFRAELERLMVPGEATLGGGRAAELRLSVESQVGGTPGALVVEAQLTPSGDDPYPLLRWLLFEQRAFAAGCVSAIDRLLAQ